MQFEDCNLKTAIEDNYLNIPPAQLLPNSRTQAPFVVVADEAFGLKTYLMRPYPGRDLPREERAYNYRYIIGTAFTLITKTYIIE